MMRSLDLIAEEQGGELTPAQPASQAGGQVVQQPNTQPEDHGGSGKLFTQEEVNRIVSERLARERAKQTPDPALQDLEARENRLKCREYLMSRYYDAPHVSEEMDHVLNLLKPQSVEDLEARTDELEALGSDRGITTHTPAVSSDGINSNLRKIFGL